MESAAIIFTFNIFSFNIHDLYICCCSMIDGSELSGKIPEFIGNWTNIEELWVISFCPFFCSCYPLGQANLNLIFVSVSQGFARNIHGGSYSILHFIVNKFKISVSTNKFIYSCSFSIILRFFALLLLRKFIRMSNRFFSSRRISDLNGSSSPFPNLQAMKNLENLWVE